MDKLWNGVKGQLTLVISPYFEHVPEWWWVVITPYCKYNSEWWWVVITLYCKYVSEWWWGQFFLEFLLFRYSSSISSRLHNCAPLFSLLGFPPYFITFCGCMCLCLAKNVPTWQYRTFHWSIIWQKGRQYTFIFITLLVDILQLCFWEVANRRSKNLSLMLYSK